LLGEAGARVPECACVAALAGLGRLLGVKGWAWAGIAAVLLTGCSVTDRSSTAGPVETPDVVAGQIAAIVQVYFPGRQAIKAACQSASATACADAVDHADASLRALTAPAVLRSELADLFAADSALSQAMRTTPATAADAARADVQASNSFSTALSFQMGLHGVEEPSPT
jgi:hypothetical protein